MRQIESERLRLLGRAPILSHSGKLGDIVYSLAAVRSLGTPCELVLKPGAHMSFEASLSIIPLIEAQPWHLKSGVSKGEDIDFDLDVFRRYGLGYNLADAHLVPLDLPISERDLPWLSIKVARSYSARPIIFARSRDYRGIRGFWEEAYNAFGYLAAFVGTEFEHMLFESEIGPIPKIETSNLLELAEVIAGAQLFVGNQSCPLAIAEGFKKTIIQEVCIENPNCIFYRADSYPILSGTQMITIFQEVMGRFGLALT